MENHSPLNDFIINIDGDGEFTRQRHKHKRPWPLRYIQQDVFPEMTLRMCPKTGNQGHFEVEK